MRFIAYLAFSNDTSLASASLSVDGGRGRDVIDGQGGAGAGGGAGGVGGAEVDLVGGVVVGGEDKAGAAARGGGHPVLEHLPAVARRLQPRGARLHFEGHEPPAWNLRKVKPGAGQGFAFLEANGRIKWWATRTGQRSKKNLK